MEYLLTFFQTAGPSVPPPTIPLTGFQLHDTAATDTTVTFVFDLFLQNPYYPSKTARLRGWSLAAFNEVSKITSQMILYPT
jgi:hypothetical protein